MNKKTFIFFITLLIIAVLIGMPQINIPHYVQSTITSKFIIFIYSCIAIYVLFIIYIISYKLKPIYISKLDVILLIILGYIGLNRYIIQPQFGFSIPYMELLGLGLLYFVLRNLNSKSFFWILLAIVISGIIQAIYGNLQLLGYYPSNHSLFKLTGSFFNPGPYAGFLTVIWPITLGMYLFKEKIITQIQLQITSKYKVVSRLINIAFEYIPILGVVSILLVLPATHSRAAWLGTFLSGFILIEYRYYVLKSIFKGITRKKKILLILVSIVIISIVLFGIHNFKKNSSNGRLFIWNITTNMIKENLVFGVGFDNFKAHYMNYQADYFAKNSEPAEAILADNTYYAFNEWLQYIAENGFIGLLLVLILLYVLYNIYIEKKYRFVFFLLSAGLLAIGIFAFFSYPMQILPIKSIVIVLLALLAAFDVKKWIFFEKHRASKQIVSWSLKIIILVFGLIGFTKSIEYTRTLEKSFKTWKLALNKYQYNNYEASIKEYKKIYPTFKNNGEFLMNYGKALSIAKQNKQAVDILEEAKYYLNTTIIETALGDSYKALRQYNHAELCYQHASNMIPSRFYPMYLLAKLYDERGKKGQTIIMAKKILNKEVKIPSTAIKEIQTEMMKIIKKYKLVKE